MPAATATTLMATLADLLDALDTARDADEATVKRLARDNDNVARFIAGQTELKTVVVPGRLVNIVVKR